LHFIFFASFPLGTGLALRLLLLCSSLTTVTYTELVSVNHALTCSPQASPHFDSSNFVVDTINFYTGNALKPLLGQQSENLFYPLFV